MTHICRFLMTQTRGGPVYYACHVCGAVKQHFLPGDPDKAQPGSALVCDEKQGESVRKPTEPCYFTVMGEKSRGANR